MTGFRAMSCSVLAASLIFAASSSSRASLMNPGFETGMLAGWSTFGQGWRTGTGADAHSGTYGAVNDVLTTDVDSFRGIFQNFAATPGQSYSLSAWVRSVNVESSRSFLEIQFLDAGSSVIGQVQSADVTMDAPFQQLIIPQAIAPAGTVTVSYRGIVQMFSAPTVNADFQIFDDFQVPEPVSAVLLGASVVGLLCRGGGRRAI